MRTIQVKKHLSDEAAAELAGVLLDDSHYDFLAEEDLDLVKPDGTFLMRFRKKVLPPGKCYAAYQNLREAASKSNNRGIAAGIVTPGHVLDRTPAPGTMTKTRFKALRKDGTVSKTNYAAVVDSGIIGYFDRNPRIPYCRQTAFNARNAEKFEAAMPFMAAVSNVFKTVHPERWEKQAAICARTSPDFVIKNTVFTTITVNKNWQTAVHQDAGDYREGYGVMSVLRAGEFKGGYLVFPQYRVAVDMRTTDVLLADVHEWHGNTKLVGRRGYERISCVFYYRENMIWCGTANDELHRAKRRQKGQPINNDNLREESD